MVAQKNTFSEKSTPQVTLYSFRDRNRGGEYIFGPPTTPNQLHTQYTEKIAPLHISLNNSVTDFWNGLITEILGEACKGGLFFFFMQKAAFLWGNIKRNTTPTHLAGPKGTTNI